MPISSTIPDRNRLNYSWLMTLRWSSFAGQVATIVCVQSVIGVPVPVGLLLAIVGVGVASNVAASVWLSRAPQVDEKHLAWVMALDIALLTLLLFFTGGPFNPFSFLYLVNIALAAVVLVHAYWTWALVGFAVSCFGLLSVVDYWPLPIEHLAPAQRAALLTRGMWVAFAVAAVFIVHFLWRATTALARRDRELDASRTREAREDQLVSLATMAAGAAHELATPLGTIALVAKELERTLERAGSAADVVDDLRLIREQVGRCRLILDQMAGSVGKSSEQGVEAVTLSSLLTESITGVRPAPPVELSVVDEDRILRVPPRAVAQVLRSLITNAQDASDPSSPVHVSASLVDEMVHVAVRDRGVGMSADVVARVCEPFFTTKEPGSGMGLGMFLSRAVIEKLGGTLSVDSAPGTGTKIEVTIPA